MGSVPPAPAVPQIAGAIVAPCPLRAPALLAAGGVAQGSLLSSRPLQKDVPCDIAAVTLRMTFPQKPPVVLTGTEHRASGPLSGASPEVNALLDRHSVVIVYTGPATRAEAAAPSVTNQIDPLNAGSLKATANVSYSMACTCGFCPLPLRDPAIDVPKGDADNKLRKLSAETKEWTVTEFLKTMFSGGKFREFIVPSSDEVSFLGLTCGMPASGQPKTSLSAFARVALADEWRGEFQWAEGFKLTSAVPRRAESARATGPGSAATAVRPPSARPPRPARRNSLRRTAS